jgi:hypothetical protein
VPQPGWRVRFADGAETQDGARAEIARAGRSHTIAVAAGRPMREVLFPVLRLPPGEALTLPLTGGATCADLAGALRRAGPLALTYPGPLTMQFWQYGDLYVATDDATGRLRRWEFRPLPDGSVEAALAQPAGDATSYRSPYATHIERGRRTWFEAAQRYRRWALAQPWCARGPLAKRAEAGDLPAWLAATDLWAWSRGPGDAVAGAAETLQRAVQARVSLLWYWWHRAPYDHGFPDYLPPREGEASFRATLARCHAAGIPVTTYINGRLGGLESDAWRNTELPAAAARTPDGELYEEVYNLFTGARMAAMCPGTAGWRQVLFATVTGLAALGVDGVYLDQIGIRAASLCWSADHGHAPGDPAVGVAGYRRLLTEIRQRIGRGRTALFTESCAEVYLDLFDAFLVLDWSQEKSGFRGDWGRQLEQVPLWSAVYHDYGILFGSYAALDADTPFDPLWQAAAGDLPLRRDDGGAYWLPAGIAQAEGQATWELGRAVAAGQMPMLANFRPEQAALAAAGAVAEAAAVYHQGGAALRFGRMLPPPGLGRGKGRIRSDWIVKWLYTPPGGERRVRRQVAAVADGAFGLGRHRVVVGCNLSARTQSLPGPLGWAGARLPRHAIGAWVDGRPAGGLRLLPGTAEAGGGGGLRPAGAGRRPGARGLRPGASGPHARQPRARRGSFGPSGPTTTFGGGEGIE